MDAEEVADRAIEKVTLRPGNTDVPLAQRLFKALEDARADYFRRRDARPKVSGDEIPEIPLSTAPGARLELIETGQAIREALGDDALQFVFWKISGYTEREIAEMDGWDPLRAGRTRRRLERHAASVHDLILGNQASQPNKETAS